MSRLHLEVSVEYVRRLLKGKITLKNKDMQERAAEVVWGNCQTLHNVFLSEVRTTKQTFNPIQPYAISHAVWKQSRQQATSKPKYNFSV